jgi:hypothetical protein
MPTLSSAKITFQTGDDDKRKESSLDISVRDNTDNLIAKAVDSFGLFDNNTINGPFDLQVLNPADISTVKQGGSVVLSWTPWAGGLGNTDEWPSLSGSRLLRWRHVAIQEDNTVDGWPADTTPGCVSLSHTSAAGRPASSGRRAHRVMARPDTTRFG